MNIVIDIHFTFRLKFQKNPLKQLPRLQVYLWCTQPCVPTMLQPEPTGRPFKEVMSFRYDINEIFVVV